MSKGVPLLPASAFEGQVLTSRSGSGAKFRKESESKENRNTVEDGQGGKGGTSLAVSKDRWVSRL